MASALFSSSNPFRRKPEEGESPAVAQASASRKKRKTGTGDENEEASAGIKRLKSTKSGSRKRKVEEAEVDKADVGLDEEDDEQLADTTENVEHDDEEKMRRTVFVGNLPTSTKKKLLMREFSCFGAVESARLRSVPVGNIKIPRKGAVNTGQLSENRSSLNAFLVFKDEDSAKAAVAHNMKEIGGKHIRVDLARPSSEILKNGVTYDKTRSVFVGNLPLDVEDEELYSLFTDGSPEAQLEAIRVVRDQKTNIGKGFAFVLFKTKDGVKHTLERGEVELRGRKLRIHRVIAKKAEAVSRKNANPRQRRRPEKQVKSSERKVATYEGTRASDKKQKRKPVSRVSTKKQVAEKSEAKKKRPAIAAKKARQKGLKVDISKKKNKPSFKEKNQ